MEFENNKLEWEEYELLAPYERVKHATFLRHGGVSTGKYSSLNLGNNTGDNPEHVKVNREIVREFLELDRIVYPTQEHGTAVELVTKENKKVPVADALITKDKNIGLAITHADCQAAIFYDSKNKALGVAHAGYKGLIQNIYQSVVESMGEAFDSDPKDLIVCISASIGAEHAEYKDYKNEFPEELWSFQEKENYFNLRDIAKKQLMDAGVQEQNIEITENCTVCNEKDYFSYRRDKKCGRHATIAALVL